MVNIKTFNDFVKELNIVVEGTTFNWRKVLKHPQGLCVTKEDFKLMKIKECSIKTQTHITLNMAIVMWKKGLWNSPMFWHSSQSLMTNDKQQN